MTSTSREPSPREPPTDGPDTTVEAWARAYVSSTELSTKLRPPPVPERFEPHASPEPWPRPGRPRELVVSAKAKKSPGPEALRAPARRAQVLHGFLHHELQAAELMAAALLCFPDAPLELRRGIARVITDELRHMALYEAHLATLGVAFGALPVRDWFWERVPACTTMRQFLAVMGVGFEGGNLDHSPRFAERFRAVGDDEGARLLERVADEEIAHVRLAARWFLELEPRIEGPLALARWMHELPAPLSPLVMRGRPLDRRRRLKAGLPPSFVEELEAWQPSPSS